MGPEVDDAAPRWSPDGRLILFWRSWDGWKLELLDAQGALSSAGKVTPTNAAAVVAEDVAPTGEHWRSEPAGADIGPASQL